jgi:hypothetical protein
MGQREFENLEEEARDVISSKVQHAELILNTETVDRRKRLTNPDLLPSCLSFSLFKSFFGFFSFGSWIIAFAYRR